MESTEQSPLSSTQMRQVRGVARRAGRHHEQFTAAEPQVIREWLWPELTGEFDPEIVRMIYPLILSARRVALRERNLTREEGLTMEEQSAAVIRLFGRSPAVRPLDAPLKSMDN